MNRYDLHRRRDSSHHAKQLKEAISKQEIGCDRYFVFFSIRRTRHVLILFRNFLHHDTSLTLLWACMHRPPTYSSIVSAIAVGSLSTIIQGEMATFEYSSITPISGLLFFCYDTRTNWSDLY